MMGFRDIESADFARLKALFEKSEHPHSEYSLASTIVWDRCIMTTGCAMDGEDVFLSETNPADPKERFLLLPIPGGGRFPPAALKQKALEAGFAEYRFVHDSYIAEHGMEEVEKHFKVSEQPGCADYVYRAKDLASLEGRDLAKKRNNIRQFEKECVAHGWKVETVRLSSANAAACVECLEQWRNEQEDANWTGILVRRQAIRGLGGFEGLSSGLMVLINGAPRGFGVAAPQCDTGAPLREGFGTLQGPLPVSRPRVLPPAFRRLAVGQQGGRRGGLWPGQGQGVLRSFQAGQGLQAGTQLVIV